MDRLTASKTELFKVIIVEMLPYCVKSKSESIRITTSLVTFTRIMEWQRSG